MFSDLTLGPSVKVKRWFTGFGELSFQWIQICIGSLMRRSCLKVQDIQTCYPKQIQFQVSNKGVGVETLYVFSVLELHSVC